VDADLRGLGLQTVCEEENEKLGKLIGISSRMRRPLEMQTHKAIPIPQYAPKFEAEYSRGKRVDPDAERNEAAKIKALYKKERKGAIRELRKDAKFLAVERNKERKEKDVEYEKRMRSVVGSITTTERAEEKAAERFVNCHNLRWGFGTSDRTDTCMFRNSQRKGSRQAKRRTKLDGILFGILYYDERVVFYLISVCIASRHRHCTFGLMGRVRLIDHLGGAWIT
jgi:hypothetical protein